MVNSNINNPNIISIDSNVRSDPYQLYDDFFMNQLNTQNTYDVAPITAIDPSIFKTPEYVRGEMITSQLNVSDDLRLQNQTDVDDHIKKRLIYEIADRMLKNKYVEFTKQVDHDTGNIIYRARAYLTPDDKVRKLRLSSK